MPVKRRSRPVRASVCQRPRRRRRKMREWIFLVTFTLQLCMISGQGNKGEDRIIGGSTISIEKAPYMLSFMLDGQHVCGAAIISKHWGVTAAHCATAFRKDPYKEITIRSGSTTINKGGVIHRIIALIWHENYEPDFSDYDLAVFKVNPPFNFSDVTRAVPLPKDNEPVDVSMGLVTGWGYFLLLDTTGVDPVLSNDLRYVVVPKVKRAVCKRDYQGLYTITSRQVCYGFQEGGADSCKGDSGGPLISYVDKVLIGVTSWGDECAAPLSPGVYTDTVLLKGWIRNRTGI